MIKKYIFSALLVFQFYNVNSQSYYYNFLNDSTYKNYFNLRELEKYDKRSGRTEFNAKRLYYFRLFRPNVDEEGLNNKVDSIIYLVKSKSRINRNLNSLYEYPFVKYRYKYIGEIESINGFRMFILQAYYRDNSPLERHKEANLFLFLVNKDFFLTSAVRIGEYYKLRSLSYHYSNTNTNISSNIIDITQKRIAIARDICHNRNVCRRKDNTYYYNYEYKINKDGSVLKKE